MFRRLRNYGLAGDILNFTLEELYKMIRYGRDYFKIDLLFHVYVYICIHV